jgi:hypothetical protein
MYLSEAADRYLSTTSILLVVVESDYDAIAWLIWFAFDKAVEDTGLPRSREVVNSPASVNQTILAYSFV